MRCYNCGDTLEKKEGNLQIPSDIVDSIIINDVKYFSCPSCSELLLTDEAWEKADLIEEKTINERLMDMPIRYFVGATQAAKILGMSRQAIHKHRRIRRGFIYSIRLEGKKYYHIKSVKQFKNTGDGRFPLIENEPRLEKEYVLLPVMPQPNGLREFICDSQVEDSLDWTPTHNTSPLGRHYD